jgi:hypothetical protein
MKKYVTFPCHSAILVFEEKSGTKPIYPCKIHETLEEALNHQESNYPGIKIEVIKK